MRMLKGWLFISLLCIWGFYGCQKGAGEEIQSADNNGVNSEGAGNPAKVRLSYGDTLFNLTGSHGERVAHVHPAVTAVVERLTV